MRALLVVFVVLSLVPAASAASKREVADFVNELEAAVKANSTVLNSKDPGAVRKHNARYASLDEKRHALFVDADACSLASNSARSLWMTSVQCSTRPDKMGYELLKRRQEDYLANLKGCRQRLIIK